MTNQPIQSNDPYAPPPRYQEKSGGIVRYAILAALLGGGAFAYMQFANSQENAASLDAARQEQVMAETSDINTAYQVETPTAAALTEPQAPSAQPSPRPTEPTIAPADSLPAPTTTVEPRPAPQPPVDLPSGE